MRPISRKRGSPAVVTAKLKQVFAADRAWFDAHPDETEYIRDFAPGEFPAEELPVLPPGFTYATRVTVLIRNEHGAVGRYRELMMVSNDREALENLPEEWKRRDDLRFCGWK
jgi:hypothetical protein